MMDFKTFSSALEIFHRELHGRAVTSYIIQVLVDGEWREVTEVDAARSVSDIQHIQFKGSLHGTAISCNLLRDDSGKYLLKEELGTYRDKIPADPNDLFLVFRFFIVDQICSIHDKTISAMAEKFRIGNNLK